MGLSRESAVTLLAAVGLGIIAFVAGAIMMFRVKCPRCGKHLASSWAPRAEYPTNRSLTLLHLRPLRHRRDSKNLAPATTECDQLVRTTLRHAGVPRTCRNGVVGLLGAPGPQQPSFPSISLRAGRRMKRPFHQFQLSQPWIQSSSLRPSMRENSPVLCVTRMASISKA